MPSSAGKKKTDFCFYFPLHVQQATCYVMSDRILQSTGHHILYFFLNDTAPNEIYTLSLHDALPILTSRTDTYPAITVRGTGNAVQHEASVSQVSTEQIFYMQQRGLTEAQAMSLSVNGFVNDLVRQFPMEYSVELKRLIELEMEGSVG